MTEHDTTLAVEDRLAIHELLALHGHLVDDGAIDDLDSLFTEDAIYDVSALGFGSHRGLERLRELFQYNGDGNPVGHHVTNVMVRVGDDGVVRVRSKGLGVLANGSSGSVIYEDIVKRTARGWRIAERKVRRKASTP
ncbi:nuclear transport factor 2 family protein [Sorangium sp. So ce1182]|uniref:nuclear transport factor 2 family protein n=1 Tax=Sorangium sp. So ce1182 TaxID=3133334 RepID=UPI003F60B799